MKVFRIFLLLIFGKAARKPLEVGKYYKQVGDLCLYRVTRITKYNEYLAFGQNFLGEWRDNRTFGSIDSPKALWYEISEEEFIEAVMKEIRDREYCFENIDYPVLDFKESDIDINMSNWYWNEDFNTLYTKPMGKGGAPIYKEGTFIRKK